MSFMAYITLSFEVEPFGTIINRKPATVCLNTSIYSLSFFPLENDLEMLYDKKMSLWRHWDLLGDIVNRLRFPWSLIKFVSVLSLVLFLVLIIISGCLGFVWLFEACFWLYQVKFGCLASVKIVECPKMMKCRRLWLFMS